MKRATWIVLLFLMIPFSFLSAEDIVSFGTFGGVHVYQPAKTPASNVVLLVSGDGGWVRGVVQMAHLLAEENNAFVIGINIHAYFRGLKKSEDRCSYLAGDFEALSMFIQNKYEFKDYLRPLLMGYSSGATLVYAALAQAPPDTFLGAMSFGFCPDLRITKTLCKGHGLEWTELATGNRVDLLPAKTLQNPWIAFQGEVDQVCNKDTTESFVNAVPRGEFVPLPKVGHGFKNWKNWLPKFDEEVDRLNRHAPGIGSIDEP